MQNCNGGRGGGSGLSDLVDMERGGPCGWGDTGDGGASS